MSETPCIVIGEFPWTEATKERVEHLSKRSHLLAVVNPAAEGIPNLMADQGEVITEAGRYDVTLSVHLKGVHLDPKNYEEVVEPEARTVKQLMLFDLAAFNDGEMSIDEYFYTGEGNVPEITLVNVTPAEE